jgi:hypothetical protein
MRNFLSVAVWGSMYVLYTFHNTRPSKATTVNAKTKATLIKIILFSRSTWSRPRSALGGYRLAYERSLAGFLFPIHSCTPLLPYQEKYGASHRLDRERAIVYLMYLAMSLNTRPRPPRRSIWRGRIDYNRGRIVMDRHKERNRARRKRRKAKEADERRRDKRNQARKRRSDDLMEAWRRNHPSEY